MIDKKELISTYLQQFGSHYQISRLLNPTLRIDDEFISHFFEQVVDQYGETFAITEEEKTEIERKIKSQYCIFQDEGAALVGDYEHDFMWYANLQAQEDYDEYYWPRYKAHLENKNFSPAGIDTLENKTLPKLMSYIGNPNEDSPFSIRGLVVGDVQSGKTSNYLGLITKAADAGYKVIFLLTGTIESLRRQTQKRVEEGFIGYDSVNAEDVGVGRGSRTPKAFTSRNNDFTGKNDQNTTYKINDNASEPMIFVIKKNVSVLKKLYASLKNINTSSAVSQITVPMIMIDDEADNASINTNKKDEDPTKINNYIRKILTLFARNTYVGFTATPFANVFISYDTQDEMLADDLFPRHFIYSLESPSNYCGAQKYFFESNSNVRFINDYDDKVFPLRHKKEWDGDKLFPSFYHSINVFLLANAIRDIREVEKNTHRSILPPSLLKTLVAYKETVDSEWMFPSPTDNGRPRNPSSVRKRLQLILERAGCKKVRFHDLRHTFATMALEHGMDVKTLSATIGHVSSATTLDIYSHITDTMQRQAAVHIDRKIGGTDAQMPTAEPSTRKDTAPVEFTPYKPKIRKPGTGCVTMINDHLYEGRYTPTNAYGKRESHNIYAKTREECEEKLAEMIAEVKAQIKAEKEKMTG